MTKNEKTVLLKLARESVTAAACGLEEPAIPGGSVCRMQGGAFVTLKLAGRLRGCIGHFNGLGSLGETVRTMAREAASADPRFVAVSPDEAEKLKIEISVLSPMKRVKAEEVQPGIHGLYIRNGRYRGTLLPQVAVEEGWDRETFLAHTCMKAGLHPGAYMEKGTEILVYTAEVFGEKTNEENKKEEQ